MFLKEKINKKFFERDGFVLLDTSLSNNSQFSNLSDDI